MDEHARNERSDHIRKEIEKVEQGVLVRGQYFLLELLLQRADRIANVVVREHDQPHKYYKWIDREKEEET